MAGTISGLNLSQQLDNQGEPLIGGQLYFFAAGTDTPQSAYVDVNLTIPYPNPYTLNAAGRIPAFFLADGLIKVKLTDRFGIVVVEADNQVVTGPSSGGGGGGGSTVNPNTLLRTGNMLVHYGLSLDGFVRMNARTIGSITSGATERANADTQSLFVHLWNTDTTLAVSGGRGVSGAADFTMDKTIALPDWRGKSIFGLDDMGNVAANRLTSTYFGTSTTTLGNSGGGQSVILTTGNLPPHVHANPATTAEDAGHGHNTIFDVVSGVGGLPGGGSNIVLLGPGSGQINGSITKTSATENATHKHFQDDTGPAGSSAPVAVIPPAVVCPFFIKL